MSKKKSKKNKKLEKKRKVKEQKRANYVLGPKKKKKRLSRGR